jgi:hypothetical protein
MTKKFLWLTGYQWTCVLYVAVAIFSWQLKYFRHIDNNYLIFREAYYHARAHLNLYAAYPNEYYDMYYYGPLFSLFVAPFAIPPESAGFFLWEAANAATILIAVNMLPLDNKRKMLMLLFCVIEFANSVFYMQFNPMITAFIIFSFVLVKKEKDEWATFFVVLGALVKLYPIIGLTFFVFSKHKTKFIIWTVIWSGIMFILPMLISSPVFVIQSYHQWFEALSYKNGLNVSLDTTQDWCLMGVVRRLSNNPTIANLPFLIAGATIFALPLLRFKQYQFEKFQLQILASSLIMVVLFSTGSEHPTFIISMAGASLYILIKDKPFTTINIVFIVLLLITALSPTDVFPRPWRVWMGHYAVKAWPVILIWFKMAWELGFKDFEEKKASVYLESELVKS